MRLVGSSLPCCRSLTVSFRTLWAHLPSAKYHHHNIHPEGEAQNKVNNNHVDAGNGDQRKLSTCGQGGA